MASVRPDRRREKMTRVTADRPCPICDKPEWCLIAPDGTAAICARTESGKRCGDAGWLHRLADPVDPPAPKPTFGNDGKDWPAEAERLAKRFTPDRRAELADRLGLPAAAFDHLTVGAFDDAFTFPEVDEAGAVVGILRRFPNGDKKTMPGSKRGLVLPAGWRDRPDAAFVVEGPTDTLAMTAAGLAAVGRPSNNTGTATLAKLFADWPADRGIVVVGENDRKKDGNWPGKAGAEAVARGLAAKLRRAVAVAYPPAGSKDVRDWLTHPDRGEIPWPARGAELATLLLAGAEAGHTPAGDEPTVIEIGTDEHRVNRQAAAALGADPDLYQRGGLLVHVVEQHGEPDPSAAVRRPAGSPAVRPLARSLLRERLTRCVNWVKWQGAGEKARLESAHPPDWCVGAVFDRGHWPGVRRLEGVVAHPVMLPDGGILTARGYDPATGLLACIPPELVVSVPDRPTRDDVAAAAAELLDPVCDLPFETHAHRAAWLASLLTPLAWHLFDGPAPLFLTDANVRAAGKGLSVDVVALALTGRRFPVMSYTADREELRKRITTLAVEGERAVLLDNLAGAVGNDVLDAALTADTWKDRVLGSNKVFDGPLHVVWYATGNNVQLQADTSRRTCHIRMESPHERPETKADFKYPNLREHVRANRGRLVSAALTILRGWHVAGRPTHGLSAWGSYEGWSDVVREAVVFAGLPDPGETRLALQTAADRDAAAMAAVIAGMVRIDPDRRGLTAACVIDRCKSSSPDADLRSAVEDLCGRLDGRLLGYKLRHFARRNFGGWMVDRAGETGGSNRWVVLAAGPRADRPDDAPYRPYRPSSVTTHRGDRGDRGDHPAGRGDGRLFTDPPAANLPD